MKSEPGGPVDCAEGRTRALGNRSAYARFGVVDCPRCFSAADGSTHPQKHVCREEVRSLGWQRRMRIRGGLESPNAVANRSGRSSPTSLTTTSSTPKILAWRSSPRPLTAESSSFGLRGRVPAVDAILPVQVVPAFTSGQQRSRRRRRVKMRRYATQPNRRRRPEEADWQSFHRKRVGTARR